MQDYLFLFVGLAALLVGGDILVRGAVGLAARLGIPPLIIGLTIVSFGTSAPELFVSIDAAINGVGGIAVGNVVGSNIANVLLVMGLPALFVATACNEEGILKNTLVMIGVSIVFMAMMLDGKLQRYDGVILFVLILLFIYDQYRSAIAHRATVNGMPVEDEDEVPEEMETAAKSWPAIIATLLGGLIILPLGAEFTVNSATSIAREWNVSDAVIGLTVVALGTSLPELATTMMAVLRNSSSVAIGNVVGSNLFNITSVIGPAAMIAPITFDEQVIQFDMWVMLAASLLLLLFTWRKTTVGSGIGLAMCIAYTSYIVATLMM